MNPLPVPMPSPSLQCRAMVEADLDAVLAIEQGSHSHPWSRGNFADSLRSGCYMPLLLQHAGALPDTAIEPQPLAYLVGMPGADEAHLLNLTVHPQQRRLGLGRLLLQAFEFWATQQRAQQLWLEVRESNTAAQALYRAAGYEAIALRKHYYAVSDPQREREHAVVMRKPLALAG